MGSQVGLGPRGAEPRAKFRVSGEEFARIRRQLRSRLSATQTQFRTVVYDDEPATGGALLEIRSSVAGDGPRVDPAGPPTGDRGVEVTAPADSAVHKIFGRMGLRESADYLVQHERSLDGEVAITLVEIASDHYVELDAPTTPLVDAAARALGLEQGQPEPKSYRELYGGVIAIEEAIAPEDPLADEEHRLFVVRDPLLGDIALSPVERRALDSDIFQRQRGVKQLGTSVLLYPSAVQTRFVHALGNLELVGRMVDAAFDNTGRSRPTLLERFTAAAREWLLTLAPKPGSREHIQAASAEEIQGIVRTIARLAGMCHDLGHFPMGHVLENALEVPDIAQLVLASDAEYSLYQQWRGKEAKLHEFATIRLLERNGATGVGLFANSHELYREATVAVIKAIWDGGADPTAKALAELVSGEVDSDRAEYLRRDGWVSGSGYGQYDLARLIGSFMIAERSGAFVFRPSRRALAAVETFLAERVKAYAHLYYHNLGMLMDALLVGILLTIYGPTERRALLEEAEAIDFAPRLRRVLSSLPPRALHYERFASETGYADDATLWTFLRGVSAALESTPAVASSTERLLRLRTYLRVVLRRRRHWTSLWKNPVEYRTMGKRCRETFVAVVRRKEEEHAHPQSVTPSEDVQEAMAKYWRASTTLGWDRTTTPFLNFLARAYTNDLKRIAEQLEAMLRADSIAAELDVLIFVETEQRAAFKPIKIPVRYQLVNEEDGRLEGIDVIAPASVRAVLSLWFEGEVLVRVFVITDRELTAEQRRRLAARARVLLPDALERWYLSDPDLRFDAANITLIGVNPLQGEA